MDFSINSVCKGLCNGQGQKIKWNEWMNKKLLNVHLYHWFLPEMWNISIKRKMRFHWVTIQSFKVNRMKETHQEYGWVIWRKNYIFDRILLYRFCEDIVVLLFWCWEIISANVDIMTNWWKCEVNSLMDMTQMQPLKLGKRQHVCNARIFGKISKINKFYSHIKITI